MRKAATSGPQSGPVSIRGMSMKLRPYEPDELRRYLDVMATAFGEAFNPADTEAVEATIERERSIAAFDGKMMVATAGAFSFRLTVPGGELPAAGVTMVGVLPSHRRRGILTSMMRRQLDDVRQRGEPIAILWASEGQIYQRFGYGLASLNGSFEIERGRTAFRVSAEASGVVRIVDSDEAKRLMPPVYERFRPERPGMFARSDTWWRWGTLHDPEHHRRGASPLFHVVWQSGTEVRGYALYRIKLEWDAAGSKSELLVREVIAVTPAATRDLWRYLFDIDLIHVIKGDQLPVDHPLLLLLAEPRRLRLTVGDGLWLRIVDMAAALGGRSYSASGRVVIELADAFCEWNSGRWALDASADGARCERTAAAADIAVEAADLGAVYLGAFGFGALASAGRVRELSPGAVARADALFATGIQPWSAGGF